MERTQPTAFYRENNLVLPLDQAALAFLKKLGLHFNIPPLVPAIPADAQDGIGAVPTWAHGMKEYERVSCSMSICERALKRLGYNLQHDFILTDRHLRPFNEGHSTCNFSVEQPTRLPIVAFDLGGRFVDQSSQVARDRIRELPGAQLLGLDYGLYLLTQWLAYGQRVRQATPEPHLPQPFMAVECPGSCYSPQGNGIFNDVPRWDVYPPHGDRRGLIFGNWNWDLRARPAQGVAFAIPL